MTLLQSALLGLLQGITEFLPVSSSGHLVLAQALLPGFEQPGVLFDVMLHFATLAAVLVYFRHDVGRLVRALAPGGEPGQRRVGGWIVAATVPTGLIGVLFQDTLESLFHVPRAAAAMLLVTGTLLWLGETLGRPRDGLERFGLGRSLAVGTVQGLAIVPGISRSGSTIAAACLMGVRPEDAARFSFLLSIPAIVGAVVLQLPHLGGVPREAVPVYALGMATAFVSGVAAIGVLMVAVRNARFRWFALYCWALGIGYLLWGP